MLRTVQFDENYVEQAIDVVLLARGLSSLDYKQRRDLLLLWSIDGGVHLIGQPPGPKEGIGERLSGRTNVLSN